MHDINNDKAPANMLNLFQKTSDIHSYNTRSSPSSFKSQWLLVFNLCYSCTYLTPSWLAFQPFPGQTITSFFVQRTKNELKKLNKLNKTEVACLQNLIHVTFGRDEEVTSCKWNIRKTYLTHWLVTENFGECFLNHTSKHATAHSLTKLPWMLSEQISIRSRRNENGDRAVYTPTYILGFLTFPRAYWKCQRVQSCG